MKSSKAVMFGSFGKIFSSKSEPQNEPQSIVEKDLILMPVWIRKIVTAAYARSLDNTTIISAKREIRRNTHFACSQHMYFYLIQHYLLID